MSKHPKSLTPEAFFHEVGTHYVVAEILFNLNQTPVLAYLFDKGEVEVKQMCSDLNLNFQVVLSLFDYLANVTPLFAISEDQNKVGLTEFGKSYLTRFSRRTADGLLHLNFWDVRVGAYGNVWRAVDKLSTNESQYGKDVKREGKFAEGGVFKAAQGFWPSIESTYKKLDGLDLIAELGINSGLIKFVDNQKSGIPLMGIDRSQSSVDGFRKMFGHSDQIKIVCEDITDVKKWGSGMNRETPKLFFSIHFHEFMAQKGLVEKFMRNVRDYFDQAYILAFEQPRYETDERDKMSEHLWLYSQSNILIHHLIGNGRILKRGEWMKLFESTGGKVIEHKPTGYLGYEMFLIKL